MLEKALNFIIKGMRFGQGVMRWVRDKFGPYLILFGPLLMISTYVGVELGIITDGLEQLTGMLGEARTVAAGHAQLPNITAMWNMACYFFPCMLAIQYGLFLGALKCICMAIRIIKSMIPTIA